MVPRVCASNMLSLPFTLWRQQRFAKQWVAGHDLCVPFCPRLRPRRLQSSYEIVDYSAARRVITVLLAVSDGVGAPFVAACRTVCGQPIHGPERFHVVARFLVASFRDVSMGVVLLFGQDAVATLFDQRCRVCVAIFQT